MASILSRRLTPKQLFPLNPQNPNPNSLPALFQAYSHLRHLAQPNPTSPFSVIPCKCNPTSSRFPVETPTNPISSFLISFSLSNLQSQIPPNQKHAYPNPSLLKTRMNPSQNPFLRTPICPNPSSIGSRSHSSSPEEGSAAGSQPELSEFKHQEITGPTVERDESALANETRQVIEALRKSIYDLSTALAALGVAHLGLGAWIAYAAHPADEVSLQGLMAFAFPFSAAFLMRRSLKNITFFRKMEEQGRLQILTLALQSFKSLNQLMLRTRVIVFCCVLGISAGSLATLFLRQQNMG